MNALKRYLTPIFLVLLVIICYANSINNGFVSDDISGLKDVASSWTTPMVAVTRTVIHGHMVIWYYLYRWFGLNPAVFRLENIICHALSVLLVYAIVSRLMNRRIAFLSAALFAVHPIIVESVTWISGGLYVLYGMFFLLSLWLYLQAGDGKKVKPLLYFFSLMCYLLSLIFSEKAVVLFLIFILYEWCYGNVRKSWLKLIPYIIVSIIFISLYIVQIPGRVSGVIEFSGGGYEGFYNPLIQLPIAITEYFRLIFWPKDLTLYHSEMQFVLVDYLIRLVIFCGYIVGILYTAVKNRKICFWMLWFFIPLLPTLTPLKIAWLVAERYAYLSVIGIFVLITYWFEWSLQRLMCVGGPPSSARNPAVCHEESLLRKIQIFMWSEDKKKLRKDLRGEDVGRGRTHNETKRSGMIFFLLFMYSIAWFGVLLALSVRTIQRNRDWTNEDTLWFATAETSPSIPYTWNNMGDVYSRRGDYKTAAVMFKRALTLNPRYADACHNLGETYNRMGEIGDAMLVFEKALEFDPTLWQSHQSLAAIYIGKKDYQKALYHIQEALKIVPDNFILQRAREELQKNNPY